MGVFSSGDLFGNPLIAALVAAIVARYNVNWKPLPSSGGYVSRHHDKRMHFSPICVLVCEDGELVHREPGGFRPGLYVHQNRMWHLHIAGASHMRAREYVMALARWPTYNS